MPTETGRSMASPPRTMLMTAEAASLSLSSSMVLAVEAEVHDVVKALVRQVAEGAGHRDRGARTGLQGAALAVFLGDGHHRHRRAGRVEAARPGPPRRGPVGHHQQAAARQQCTPVGAGVGVFDAGPRLHQGHGGRAQVLRDGDQVPLTRAGLDHDPLVQQDVLLQAAFEGVAEGGVGASGQQVAVVGLHQAALADPDGGRPPSRRPRCGRQPRDRAPPGRSPGT